MEKELPRLLQAGLNDKKFNEEQYEALKVLIYEIADAVAKKYADALLASGLPQNVVDQFSALLPTGVASEEIVSRFPLYSGKPRLDLTKRSPKD